jgi:glycine hydroxymethyltransferase
VILGSSNFLFPHPVREIAACLSESPDTVLAYDASHVFGLLACGAFQKPLAEGAHIAFGSTHKTLPGPQGGLIIGNDKALMDAVGIAVYPGIVTNHHLMRSPALGIALQELQHNPDYAAQIVSNGRALAGRLEERDVRVVAADRNYTESHTILLAVSELGPGKEVAMRLEAADIMASYSSLPAEYGKDCVRMGTSEVTRLGAQEADMVAAADIVADVLLGNIEPEAAKARVHQWSERLGDVRYSGL